MLTILMIAGLAYGFARVLDAPRVVMPLIPLCAVLAMAATLLILPETHPFRQSVSGSIRLVLLLGLLAIPVLLYAKMLKRLKPDVPEPPSTDFVLITDDAALSGDVQTLQKVTTEPAFSVLKRGADGGIRAAGRCEITGEMALFLRLYVAEPSLLAALVDTLEREAILRGARRAQLDILSREQTLPLPPSYREVARLNLGSGCEKLVFTKDPL